ncbi:MAG: hypothetical protein NC918_00035 [Candidatus Omnitrophica bacterium]|nr:hypothetical protein [Candidatus Omnitrophota bacterium]
MKTKKGYISFILFSLISLIILYPLIFYKSTYPGWPSFVLKKTFSEHVLQKRAIIAISLDTFEQLKPIIVALKNTKIIKTGISSAILLISVFFPPAINLVPLVETLTEPLVKIASSYEAREAFVKLTIFLAWYDLSQKWEKNSDYSFSIECSNPTYFYKPSFVEKFFQALNLDHIISKIPFFVGCYHLLEYQDSQEPSQAGKLIIYKGINLITQSKVIKEAKASSSLIPFEVS